MHRLFALILLLLALAAPAAAADRPVTILVSLDGFRPDYLDRGVTPVLSRLAREGVRGAMRPSFPTKTFPNHYALVTGLRPDRNGIVDNTFEDVAIPGVTFKMSNREAVRDARWWDQAEPIWVTAERTGVLTAPIFWPGSEAAIRGLRPTYAQPFDETMTSAARVDQLLSFLDLPAARQPAFLTLYIEAVDTAGHDFGPDAPQTMTAVAEADAAVGRLVAGLAARGRLANLVVVADHGMAATSPDRRLFLDDLLPKEAYRYLTAGAFLTLYPTAGREAEVAQALLRPHAHMQCWAKADIPARYHYGRNARVAPYFCLPDTGWSITTWGYRPRKPELGNHGYDPESADMAAVFVANGPGFRKGVVLPAFDNVSVHPLLAHLLGLTVGETDGRLADVEGALTK